jgi:hypothetical protein
MLSITMAVPNPLGREQAEVGSLSRDRLNGEWVEFANVADAAVSISGVTLLHLALNYLCQPTGMNELTTFFGELESGYSIRVHSGSGVPSLDGKVRHHYLDRSGFIWNTACGDKAILRDATQTSVDWAGFLPYPAEGQVLRRQTATNRLR